MIFLLFSLFFVFFKFNHLIFLLVSLEFFVLSIFFLYFFSSPYFIFLFLWFSVISSVTGLVIFLGLMGEYGKDYCFF